MDSIGRGIGTIGIAGAVAAMAYFGKEWGCFWGMWLGIVALDHIWRS